MERSVFKSNDNWIPEIDNVRNFGIFAVIMGYAKERGKLEKLSEKITGLEIYNEKNLVLLTDGYEKYSHTIRILKNKEPETFEELYKNDLQGVKDAKKAVKEVDTDEARQLNFIQFKKSVLTAIENAVEATLATS